MSKIHSEYITLQQFLKLENFASTGGEAKHLVKELEIYVNGEKEDRRGRKLYVHDEVVIDGKKFMIE